MSISPDLQISPDGSSADPDETRGFVDNPAIAGILDQYLQDLQNGTACSRQELLDQHPEIADELAEYLDGIEMVAGLGVGTDWIPQQLGDFEIIEQIGQGAMGVVYRAKQISLKRPVALKVLRYAVTGKQSTKRFEREAELVATLDHSHIVPVHAFGQHESLHYFSMQLIEGESLAKWSADDPDERDQIAIARWIAEVARALAHAHQRDVVHRDVKPSNLLKDQDDKIWLTDFGLARRFDDVRMSMTGAMLGTPNYMSPEQAAPARHPIDHRTDIYSLGATLFELLTGRTVFVADTPHAVLAQVLAEEAPLLSELLPDAHRDLETIVIKCLEKEPRDRYQTATDLADDLEAFAAGNPIRGRRPGVVERFTRWRKQNKKVVRWAGATAAATLTLMAVSVAALLAWQNATTGQLLIKSEQGPIVGRLIDADGNKTPTFTIPMQQRMSVAAGRYQLQTWAKNRVGQTQDLFVKAGSNPAFDTELPDLSLFSDRTIEGIPKLWKRAEGESDGVVLLQANAIARIDAETGKEVWSIDSEQLTADSKTELAARKKLKDGKRTWEQILLQPFEWRWGRGNSIKGDDDWRIPTIAADFPDINEDQQSDLLVAVRQHPTLISVDGETGQRLWRYTSLPKHDGPNDRTDDTGRFPRHYHSGVMNQPMVVDDIDGDGINDVTAQFFSKGLCWIDAVSGKTGEQLWRIEMPKDWFDPAKTGNAGGGNAPVLPLACQISFSGPVFRHYHGSGFDWQYTEGLAFRHRKQDLVVLWQSIKLAEENLLLTVCGSRLIGHDSMTGKPSPAFNRGQSLDLGYFPALQPQIVRDGDGKRMGLLLCEMVSRANSNGVVTKPVTRFHLLSLDNATPLWTFTTNCDPGWTGVTPDWPLIKDLSGDGVPEIIVAAGGELEKPIHQGPSRVCTLQAIDAATGQPIWDQDRLPKLRCASRQVQNVVVGPDADGDQLEDIYVVCPMTRQFASSDPSSVFIDVLSGVGGQKIRSVECACPFGRATIELQKPFFWGTSNDGSPQLVLSSYRYGGGSKSNGTLFASTETGHVNHIAQGLTVNLQLAFPKDQEGALKKAGDKTLFLSAPRNGSNLVSTSDLVTVKPQPETHLNLLGDRFLPAADFDGDGFADLLNGTDQQQTPVIRAIASCDGKVLWQHAFTNRHGHSTLLDADLNGDGVKDVLVWATAYPYYRTDLTCLSGRDGQPLWSALLASCAGNYDSLHAVSRPIAGTDQFEIFVTYKHEDGPRVQSRPYLGLMRLDGKTGNQKSDVKLIAPSPNGFSFGLSQLKAGLWPVLVGDVDGDSYVVSVVDEVGEQTLTSWTADGEIRWQMPLAAPPQIGGLLVPPRVSLIEGTGDGADLIAVVSSTESSNNGRWKTMVHWHDVADGKLVANWSGTDRLLDHQFHNQFSPALWTGVPFAIRDKDRVLTGICSTKTRSSELQVRVLDIEGSAVKEVCRVDVVRDSMKWKNGASNPKFLIADIDGNGQDELIDCDSESIFATTLSTGKELVRTGFSTENSGLVGLTANSKQIEFISEMRGLRHLHLLDQKTLKPDLSVEVPSGARYGKFLSFIRSHDAPAQTFAESPRVNFYDPTIRHSSIIVPRRPGVSQGKEAAGLAAASTQMVKNSTAGLAQTVDARWVERLPWSIDMRFFKQEIFPLIGYVLQALAVCLGAVVFPIWFVAQLVRRKRWSLVVMLLMPLLFVVPYLVLHFNLEFDNHDIASDFALPLGLPVFVGRMVVSLIVLPPVAFCWFWAKSLWCGQWRRLLGISFLAAVIGGLVGAGQIAGRASQFSAGNHYQWWDWSHLMLFGFGAIVVGFLLIVFYLLRAGYRFALRLKNYKTVAKDTFPKRIRQA